MVVIDRPASQTVRTGDSDAEQLTCRIQRDVADVCGQLNVAHYRLVELLAEAIETKSWSGYGIRSPEHWFGWQSGVSPERARQFVKIARRFKELPAAFAAFRDGLLTVDQMALLATYSQPYWDDQLTSLAQHATLPQLRNALSKYRVDDGRTLGEVASGTDDRTDEHTDGDADTAVDTTQSAEAAASSATVSMSPAERRALDAGWVTHHFDDDGRYVLHANLPADVGSLVENALGEAHDRLRRGGNRAVTWTDAFADVAARSLGAVTTPSRRDLYRVYVHLDTEHARTAHGGTAQVGTRQRDTGQRGTENAGGPNSFPGAAKIGARAWINAGPTIAASIIDELMCDAVVKPLWHHGGAPINVGADHATIPTHTRRHILDRDRTCRYPGCTATRNLEIHHVRYRKRDNGPGATTNLAAHCPHHHKANHRGEYTISGNADDPHGLVYRKPDGRPINPAARPTPPGTTPPPGPPPGISYRHPLHEAFDYTLFGLPEPPRQPRGDLFPQGPGPLAA